MKTIFIGISGILIILILIAIIPNDTVNSISRKKIEYVNGNYLVTYSNDTVVKTWRITSGKVTSTEKGYYFFWDKNNKYIQVPIVNTIIEEN